MRSLAASHGVTLLKISFRQNIRRLGVKIGDLFIIIAVLLCSLLSAITPIITAKDGTVLKAEIITDDEYYSYTLKNITDTRIIEINSREHNVVIELSSHGAKFVNSDCDDKLCVSRGILTNIGDTAVCLPAGVIVRITNNNNEKPGDSEVDWIAG